MITPKFKIWLRCAVVRAVKTIAQTMAATIGTSAVLHEVDWVMVVSASLLAGLLSILTSVAGLPEADAEDEKIKLEEVRRLNGQG